MRQVGIYGPIFLLIFAGSILARRRPLGTWTEVLWWVGGLQPQALCRVTARGGDAVLARGALFLVGAHSSQQADSRPLLVRLTGWS